MDADVRRSRWRAARTFLTALPRGEAPLRRAVLDHQVDKLLAADPEVIAALPTTAGIGIVDVAEARRIIAAEHGLKSWDVACERGDAVVDPRFEAAADAIVDGDLATLRDLLAAEPGLAHARSPYGHRCTLLHHVAANGIEVCRQWQSPANAAAIARALLAAGADADATAPVYGGVDTTLTLLVSSAHPAQFGTQADVVDALIDGGARIDGRLDDSAPLWIAIGSGYNLAVDRLVARGAKLDNLVLAAAAGDLDRVRALVGTPGPARIAGTALDPARALDYALIYAAGLDRVDVVTELLRHGPDLAFREPMHDATALGMARYPHPAAGRPHGNPAIVALLTRGGSDPATSRSSA